MYNLDGRVAPLVRKHGIHLETQNFCVQMAKERIFKKYNSKKGLIKRVLNNSILKNLQRLSNFVGEPTDGTQTDNEYHSASETMPDDEV